MIEVLSRNGDEITVFESDLKRLVTTLRLESSDAKLSTSYSNEKIVAKLTDTKTGTSVTKESGRYDSGTESLFEQLKLALIDAICSETAPEKSGR